MNIEQILRDSLKASGDVIVEGVYVNHAYAQVNLTIIEGELTTPLNAVRRAFSAAGFLPAGYGLQTRVHDNRLICYAPMDSHSPGSVNAIVNGYELRAGYDRYEERWIGYVLSNEDKVADTIHGNNSKEIVGEFMAKYA